MPSTSVVIIATGEDAPTLRRWLPEDGSVAVFPDSEAIAALTAMRGLPPKLLILDRGFAMTARGAAMVAFVKGAAELMSMELRTFAANDLQIDAAVESPLSELMNATRRLEGAGTRTDSRFALRKKAALLINGHTGTLLDLSTTGAQIVTPIRLMPESTVRLIITVDGSRTLCRGMVAWCSATPVQGALVYRAGVTFQQVDISAVQALCERHGDKL